MKYRKRNKAEYDDYEQEPESMQIDTLSFRLIDPKAAGEHWAVESDISMTDAVEIYINGREIVPVLKRLEKRIKAQNDKCAVGDYGHISAGELLRNLATASDPSYAYRNHGAELLRCGNCGMSSCWSVCAQIQMDSEYVTWTLRHNHRDWDYGKKYVFERNAYEQELQRLHELADKTYGINRT